MDTLRLYRVTDQQMLAMARELMNEAFNDLAVLGQFDSTINEQQLKLLEAMISELEATLNQSLAYKTELLSRLDRTEENCISAYRKARFFVQKAFAGHTAVLSQFRINDYESSSRTCSKHAEFMSDFALATQNYVPSLLAAGASVELLEAVCYWANEFGKAHQEVERHHSRSNPYLDKLNYIYNQGKALCQTATHAFGNSIAEVYQKFLSIDLKTKVLSYF